MLASAYRKYLDWALDVSSSVLPTSGKLLERAHDLLIEGSQAAAEVAERLLCVGQYFEFLGGEDMTAIFKTLNESVESVLRDKDLLDAAVESSRVSLVAAEAALLIIQLNHKGYYLAQFAKNVVLNSSANYEELKALVEYLKNYRLWE